MARDPRLLFKVKGLPIRAIAHNAFDGTKRRRLTAAGRISHPTALTRARSGTAAGNGQPEPAFPAHWGGLLFRSTLNLPKIFAKLIGALADPRSDRSFVAEAKVIARCEAHDASIAETDLAANALPRSITSAR